MTKTLEVGTTYYGRFICNYDTLIIGTIVKRTAKFVWVKMDREDRLKKCGVKTYNGVEYCCPTGNYSMAPSLAADNPIETLKRADA